LDCASPLALSVRKVNRIGNELTLRMAAGKSPEKIAELPSVGSALF